MRPAPIPVTLAAAVIAAATALAGCSSATADGESAATNSARPMSSAGHADAGNTGPPARAFFDPCTDEMLAWFGARGLPRARYIEPQIDPESSACSIGNSEYGASVGRQLAAPGDRRDQWLLEVLRTSGDVVPATIDGHDALMSITDHDGMRQECFVAVRVDFGFIKVVGGPHGQPAAPPTRDCDRSRTLAAAILAKMAEDGWH